MKMKLVLLSFLFALSTYAVAQEENINYSGIWQNANGSAEFYVLQERDDELVLIILPGVEETGDTLRYSYIGNKDELRFTRLSDESFNDIHGIVKMHFFDNDNASLYPVCDNCRVIITEVVRVF